MVTVERIASESGKPSHAKIPLVKGWYLIFRSSSQMNMLVSSAILR
jgi:hypothetical protein